MADTKISALSANAGLVGTDLFAVVDDPAGTPATQKATISQIRDYLLALANTWTATQTITPAANTNALAVTGYSLTGSNAQSLIDLAGTWNTSGTPSGIKLSLTNTASNVASLLVGIFGGAAGSTFVAGISNPSGTSGNLWAANRIGVGVNGSTPTNYLRLVDANASTIGINEVDTVYLRRGDLSDGGLTAFGSLRLGSSGGAVGDVILARDAANTLAQRNGTSAQEFRLYKSYTDSSNYERYTLKDSASVFTITTESSGTGTARQMAIYPKADALYIGANNTTQWTFSSAGQVPNSDNAVDIGSTSSRVRRFFQSEYHEMTEQTAPSAPSTNRVRIYAQDNGAGKTQLMALFATGAAQQLAVEP